MQNKKTNSVNNFSKINNRNNNNADLVRRMFDALNTKVSKDISQIHITKYYVGIVESVDDGSDYADVRLMYGNERPLLIHIKNMGNTVLNIGEYVTLIAPNGELSNIFITNTNSDSPVLKQLGDINQLINGNDGSDIVSIINNIITRIDNIDNNNNDASLPEYPCRLIRDSNGKVIEFQYGENEDGSYIWRQLLIKDENGRVTRITQENPDDTFDIVFNRDVNDKVDVIDVN